MQASERMVAVRISYKKLWMLLLERDIKKASLRHEVGLSAGTWTKLNKGEEVSVVSSIFRKKVCGVWQEQSQPATEVSSGATSR